MCRRPLSSLYDSTRGQAWRSRLIFGDSDSLFCYASSRMITSTQIRNAEAAVTYFGRELGTSDYYLAQKGVWYGKGARILGLAPEVNKEDFVAIVHNRAPGSCERLTARNNTTRTRVVWKVDEVTQTKVPVAEEISNRRVCVDFTFSVPKSLSMYLARTKMPRSKC